MMEPCLVYWLSSVNNSQSLGLPDQILLPQELTIGAFHVDCIEIARTSIAQGQEGSAILVETY